MSRRTDHRRVLIVDDDPTVRYLLRLILQVDEFDVVGEAVDGIDAVPKAVDLQPDFIVLDQQMPRRDGAETAPLIRRAAPDAQIIACSAVIERKPLWADGFVSKQELSNVSSLTEALIDLREH